uniref:Beta-galactosidase n=1 Tax=Acrobeloides nanus TaxID=290746 RepID=A0A914DAJ3_9BILA
MRAIDSLTRKTLGLHNETIVDGVDITLNNWFACGINLTKASIDQLAQRAIKENQQERNFPEKAVGLPGVFVGQFAANTLTDTFFDSRGWGKGQLFVNGYNIGRYWPTAGPQMTLYVPKPFLQQMNTVLLIELTGAQQNFITFIDHAVWN